MNIVTSFIPFLQVFCLTMTEPTARAFIDLVTGWLFAPGRSLADRIRAIPQPCARDAYYRILSSASWSLGEVRLRLLDLMLRRFPQETLFLVGDDTFLPRKGAKVFGAGMHRDGCLSTRTRTVKRWGHCWVMVCVVFPSPRDPNHYFSVPVWVELYIDQRTARKLGRKYRSKTELMIKMLRRIERDIPQQKLHFLGDYTYTAPAVLKQFPRRIEVTGRAHAKARLFGAPQPQPGRGRPRVRGEKLASPQELLAGRAKRREFHVAPGRRYRVRAASIQGYFFQVPDRLVRVVALEHLGQRRENDVFYSTRTDAGIEQIVRWYARRWSIAVTFRDCKQHLRVGRERNRTRSAARRTAAVGFLMYGLVVLWHETTQRAGMPSLRDYRGKRHASFADMLAALRRESLAEYRRKLFTASTVTGD
jgi:hypothetical protein